MPRPWKKIPAADEAAARRLIFQTYQCLAQP
jgi:hypothetical protein